MSKTSAIVSRFRLDVLQRIQSHGVVVFDHGGLAIEMWVDADRIPVRTARWIADSGYLEPAPGRRQSAWRLSPAGRAALDPEGRS